MKYIKINSHAWIYLITLSLLAIVFYPFIPVIGILLFFIILFVAYFFRDPDKNVPVNNNIILSPADGTITYVGPSSIPPEIKINGINFNKISIFLSIFDIHVNRIPASGKIISSHYIPGKFLNATLNKSSEENERNIVLMETKHKNKIIFVQIAGLIARRIICNLNKNQQVYKGERYGIIKFGSRLDIYIPDNLNFFVAKGQKVVGGETAIAAFK